MPSSKEAVRGWRARSMKSQCRNVRKRTCTRMTRCKMTKKNVRKSYCRKRKNTRGH